MMQSTRSMPLMCHARVLMWKQCHCKTKTLVGWFFAVPYTVNVIVTVHAITGKHNSGSWVFFLSPLWEEKEIDISLLWIHMPHSAIHRGRCVFQCVSVSGLLATLTSSWWLYLTLPCNVGGVSVAMSKVNCRTVKETEGIKFVSLSGSWHYTLDIIVFLGWKEVAYYI